MAEHHAVVGDGVRIVMRTPHQRRRLHAVREARPVDHLGHLHEAAIETADCIGNRTFELDLARRHRAGAEFVLETDDAVMVRRSVIEPPRHQKQTNALRAVDRAFRPRQQHHDFRIGIGAEPFLAVQPPVIAFLHGRRGQLADVGAALLLRHELPTLRELRHVGLREAVEILCLQRVVAEARQQPRRAVGDVDRTAEAKLGLIEEKREGMLGHGRIGIGPAENTLAMRHRMDAEFAVSGAFEFAIGRMIFDPLPVVPEAVTLMQHRSVLVREARAFVEMTAGERTEAIEMRLDMLKQRCGKMHAQQVGEDRIGAIEIHARRVGRDQAELGCRRGSRRDSEASLRRSWRSSRTVLVFRNDPAFGAERQADLRARAATDMGELCRVKA